MKKIITLFMLILIILNVNIISLATESHDNVFLQTSKTEIKKDEEFSLRIQLANMEVASFDLNIFFNQERLEYVSGPENTNVVGNKIITVWYDETGGQNAKQNCELASYTFKVKEVGNDLITIQGTFYNDEGTEIENYIDGFEIVSEESEETEKIEISEQSQVPDNNAKLQILRINHEGITPIFSPDITEYYFITEDLIGLEVTAIPENTNSQVTITGNTNFKEGVNVINIQVISPDKTNKTEYNIYVTKTKELEKANANLETLAIENVTLAPEFANDIYQYQATVSNTTENLNILAIPEKQNATIEIQGGTNLEYGNNSVQIHVIAENGYTIKDYHINVYRRNKEEQEIADEEQKVNIQKINAILEQQEKQYAENSEQNQNESNVINKIQEKPWEIVVAIILIIAIQGIVIYRIKSKKKKS